MLHCFPHQTDSFGSASFHVARFPFEKTIPPKGRPMTRDGGRECDIGHRNWQLSRGLCTENEPKTVPKEVTNAILILQWSGESFQEANVIMLTRTRKRPLKTPSRVGVLRLSQSLKLN